MCSRERERERESRRRRHGGKRDHEERQREEQSFRATAIASLVTAIALLEQSFGATSFAARFVFASPSGRRRPANEANGAVSPLPPTGALAPLPPTVQFQGFGVDLETGFLLYGPPGCGETLIAKAVANEAGANFIHINLFLLSNLVFKHDYFNGNILCLHVKGPELLNKYVGESEWAVRTIFSRARTCSPCILFFDGVDALTTKRGKEGGWVVERLLNQDVYMYFRGSGKAAEMKREAAKRTMMDALP